MTKRARRYWAAVPKEKFEARTSVKNKKLYYCVHGDELTANNIGPVMRELAYYIHEGSETNFMVINYVPVPSSMHDALWLAQSSSSDVTFEVRVHEKFSFPHVDRGPDMAVEISETALNNATSNDR